MRWGSYLTPTYTLERCEYAQAISRFSVGLARRSEKPVGWGEQSEPQHIAKLNTRLSHAATLVLGFVPHPNLHKSIQSVSRG